MGVDFYSCKCCGSTFPDCGDFVGCDCGRRWCDLDCAETDGYEDMYDEDGDLFETSCSFCRKEDYSDDELLEYALGMLGISRYELVKRKNNQMK